MIDEIRTWLRSCPLIDANDRFNVNYLGVSPTEYTIEDVPTTPTIKQYLSGALKQKNFVIGSRKAYGIDILENIANSGFYDDLSSWVGLQNKSKSYPDLGTNKQVRKISTTTTSYIMESTADTAKYQIQLQVMYYESEE